MADETYEESLKKLASGAATGASMGGLPGAAIGAGLSLAAPFISKALGGLFGVSDAEEAQKAAYAPLRNVATGGTTQGQAGMAYARGRSLQDLQSMASRGTAQQQAGLQRQAMMQAPEVQAHYASQLAELRSREQERARSQLAYYEGERARQEAQRNRQALAGGIGGALEMGTKFAMSALSPDATAQAATDAALKQALGIGAPSAGGISSEEAAKALFGTAASAAPQAAAGGAAAATTAGTTAAGTSLSEIDPSVLAAVDIPDEYSAVTSADPNTPNTYFGGMFGGSKKAPKMPVGRTPLVGVTASEQAAREAQNQATFDALSNQRTQGRLENSSVASKHFLADRGVHGAGPNVKITSTPETRALQEQGAFNESIGAPQSTYYQNQSTNALMTPFGQPDLARSSYAGAQYEGPRETMNNTQMASHDRMRSSLERQVGPISTPNRNMPPMPPSGNEFSNLQSTVNTIEASRNPFGEPPEDVRRTGLRRVGKILRGGSR